MEALVPRVRIPVESSKNKQLDHTVEKTLLEECLKYDSITILFLAEMYVTNPIL